MLRLVTQYGSLLLVLLLSLFSIQPLFNSGFFSMHDDTQVARVYEMKTALADGMFPVRWVPDLGYNYGYPIFNFYGPFAYYIGGIFNLIGFDSLTATKLMIGVGMVLAGLFMYILAKEFWGRLGGIVSAILYVYVPYHALNLYVRGAIGELWAYAFIPLAFLGLYKIYQFVTYKNKSSKLQITTKRNIWLWLTVSSLSYAAIIASHNLTAMMVTPFLFLFAVALYITARRQKHASKEYFVLLSLLLGIFLAGFYWLPVLFEMKYTNVLSVVGGGSDYKDHFVCLRQLWEGQWGFAGSTAGCEADGMAFIVGKLHILLALLALIPLVLRRKNKIITAAISTAIFGVLVSIFLTTPFSKFIWDAIPHMAFFQFPWRFLVLITFFVSFLGGALFILWKKEWGKTYVPLIVCFVITGGIIYYNSKYFAPDELRNYTAEHYTNKSIITWDTSKISDEYMPPGFRKPINRNEVPKRKIPEHKNIKFLSYSEKTQVIRAEVEAKEKTALPVNIAYFPGWHVYIDNKQEWFKHHSKGLIIDVPKGKHTNEIRYSQTPVEQAGNALSLTGVLILVAGIISSRKEPKRA